MFCWNLAAFQYINTQLFAFFLTDWKLARTGLRSDAVTWSLLTRTDTDWTCWLTVRVRKHKHRFETDSDSGHPVHSGYTAYKQYTAARRRWQNSCILSSRLMTTPYAEHMLPTRFKFQETLQSEQHWHSDADFEGFICRKLKDINECSSRSNMPKDGRARYVLFFKITSEIRT